MHQGGSIDIIKRSGHRPIESFDPKKLHASIVSACLTAGTPPGQAETIARKVTDEVTTWLESRPEVTSHDIRRVAAKHLRTYHPDAGYLYEQHSMTI